MLKRSVHCIYSYKINSMEKRFYYINKDDETKEGIGISSFSECMTYNICCTCRWNRRYFHIYYGNESHRNNHNLNNHHGLTFDLTDLMTFDWFTPIMSFSNCHRSYHQKNNHRLWNRDPDNKYMNNR